MATVETRNELVSAAKLKLNQLCSEKNIVLEYIDIKDSKDAEEKEKSNFCLYFQTLLPGRFGFDLTAKELKNMIKFSNNAVFHVFIITKLVSQDELPKLPFEDYPSGILLNTVIAERNLFFIGIMDQESGLMNEKIVELSKLDNSSVLLNFLYHLD